MISNHFYQIQNLLHHPIDSQLLRINMRMAGSSRYKSRTWKAPRVRAMQVPPIPNQRSDAVCSSTLNRKALGGNRLNAHSRLLAGRKMACDCDFLGTGGRGLVTTPCRVGEIFANLSEKYAQVKLDHFPQSPE